MAPHLGDVLFGNIGLPERVSFSVIGPTVNEVARLEALTKELGRQILATGAFAGHTSIMWDNLGRHQLRGVGAPLGSSFACGTVTTAPCGEGIGQSDPGVPGAPHLRTIASSCLKFA